jgi:multidrug resistance efflux pump
LNVVAPLEATVEAVDLRPGDMISPNAPVLSLMDTSRLWVRAYVPENHLDLSIDQPVAVTVDSFPDTRFRGHISFVARQAEFTPSNVQTPEERSKQVFRIHVTLDEGLDRLRPGMSADVWLEEEIESE